MKLLITADDYGVTRGVTDSILKSVDDGAINCVSMIANGQDFDRAVDEAKKRPQMQIAVHLNLTEGKPSSDLRSGELVDSDGNFHLLFQSLLFRYLFSSNKTKFKQDIKNEVRAQILKIKNAFPGRDIFLNGHDHVHMIPFVFAAVDEVAEELNIAYVRISKEPLFFVPSRVTVYIGSGIIKHFLLNILSFYAQKIAVGKKYKTPDVFVGTLFTGSMSFEVVKCAFRKVLKRKDSPKIIEVLFHPGGESDQAQTRWPAGGRSAKWFLSTDRQKESFEVCKPELLSYFKSL